MCITTIQVVIVCVRMMFAIIVCFIAICTPVQLNRNRTTEKQLEHRIRTQTNKKNMEQWWLQWNNVSVFHLFHRCHVIARVTINRTLQPVKYTSFDILYTTSKTGSLPLVHLHALFFAWKKGKKMSIVGGFYFSSVLLFSPEIVVITMFLFVCCWKWYGFRCT